MIEQNGVGMFSHRVALAVGKDRQDAPLFDRHPLLAEAALELSVDFPVSLSEQVGKMIADCGLLSGGPGHGYDFALRRLNEKSALDARSIATICPLKVENSMFSVKYFPTIRKARRLFGSERRSVCSS